MPIHIIQQHDLEKFTLRGDEREETSYYRDNYYPNGERRWSVPAGKKNLPPAQKRETALDVAVRELKLQSKNRRLSDGSFAQTRDEYNTRKNSSNRRNDTRDTSSVNGVRNQRNNSSAPEIYGSDLPPVTKQDSTSAGCKVSGNGMEWRNVAAKPRTTKPENLKTGTTKRDMKPVDPKPENKQQERLKPDIIEHPPNASKPGSNGSAAAKPAHSRKADTASPSTERNTPALKAANGNATAPSDVPPSFYKDMIHPLKGRDGKIVPLIDIGANLTKLCYKGRMRSILERAKAAGVTTILITGTSFTCSRAAIRLCKQWNDVVKGVKLYATVGLHPLDATFTMSGKFAQRWHHSLEGLLNDEEEGLAKYVVAIGECGLDYSSPNFDCNREIEPQKQVFRRQLALADKYDLPVFAHCRKAHKDFLDMVKPWLQRHPGRLVVHCHTDPDVTHLKELLNAGAWIGLTGIITDRREGRFNTDIICEIPWDRLMIETDAPFLLPSNACAIKDIDPKWQNEPCLLPFVAEKIAQVSGDVRAAEVAAITTKNALKFFGLEDIQEEQVKVQ